MYYNNNKQNVLYEAPCNAVMTDPWLYANSSNSSLSSLGNAAVTAFVPFFLRVQTLLKQSIIWTIA